MAFLPFQKEMDSKPNTDAKSNVACPTLHSLLSDKYKQDNNSKTNDAKLLGL